jgi:hypothetical protein
VAWVATGAAMLVGALVFGAYCSEPAAGAKTTPVAHASFNADGSVKLPVGYRQWTHVGTRLKPDGISIFDGLPLQAPELLNAYVEPGAMAVFERTGQWPDGTEIVKEASAIETGPGCDPVTRICSKDIGTGLFEANFMGIGLMVKDHLRFPYAPGHWGYFSFGHHPPPYEPTSEPRPQAQCEACHVALAADTDFVILRAHLGLAALPAP